MLCQDWLRHAATLGIHVYQIAGQSQQCAVQSCEHSFEQFSHEFARHSTCIGSMWITNHTTSQETFGFFLSSPGPKRKKKVDAWGEDRQLLFFFFLSVAACLFLRRRQAATFFLSNLVIFFWFETQIPSTFQGVKDFYSLLLAVR